jgi:carboxyl-terminal processing protease
VNLNSGWRSSLLHTRLWGRLSGMASSPRLRLGSAGLLLVLVSFTAGVWVDQSFPDWVPGLGSFQQQRGEVDQGTMQQALRIIQDQYYGRPGAESLTQGSVRGMVQALNDPYSQYLSPQQYRSQQDLYAGRHEGAIGIYVDFRSGYPVVTGVLPASPALRAGLQTDDVILSVDGRDTHNLNADQTSALIRGAVGTSVRLHVRRATGEVDLTATRENFESPTVQSFRLPDQFLYVRIYQFGDGTEREFDSQLQAGLPGARGMVLDLRDNGGGLVTAAVAVISRFVARGEAFEERGRDGKTDRKYVQGDHPAAALPPLVVLVNGSSASASEIVAGSLQAHRRASLVGTRTFGKGSVQVDYPLHDGGDLHLTVEHWFLPDGRSINGHGLNPDVAVSLPAGAAMFDVVQPSRGHAADTQLNRALQILGAG